MPRVLESCVKIPTRAESLFPDFARCGRFGEQLNSFSSKLHEEVFAPAPAGARCAALRTLPRRGLDGSDGGSAIMQAAGLRDGEQLSDPAWHDDNV